MWQEPLCLLPQQPLGVVAVPVQELLAQWHRGDSLCQCGRGCRLALVSLLAVGRQGQGYAVCVYTPAQSAPQPPVALKGEALMSLMSSVFPAHLPTHRVGLW